MLAPEAGDGASKLRMTKDAVGFIRDQVDGLSIHDLIKHHLPFVPLGFLARLQCY